MTMHVRPTFGEAYVFAANKKDLNKTNAEQFASTVQREAGVPTYATRLTPDNLQAYAGIIQKSYEKQFPDVNLPTPDQLQSKAFVVFTRESVEAASDATAKQEGKYTKSHLQGMSVGETQSVLTAVRLSSLADKSEKKAEQRLEKELYTSFFNKNPAKNPLPVTREHIQPGK